MNLKSVLRLKNGLLTYKNLGLVSNQPPPNNSRNTPNKLGEGKRKDYALKNFEKAQIKDTPLTAQFKDKKVKIQPPTYTHEKHQKQILNSLKS